VVSPGPGSDGIALRLAEKLIQLLDRGGFTATYKYAVLVALLDLCMEQTSAKGLPPESVTTRQLADKAIEIYWPHCAPYNAEVGVLRQNSSKYRAPDGKRDTQAEIIRHIQRFRERLGANPAASLSLVRARRLAGDDAYEKLARTIEWKLIEMPLPRLQIIGREEDRFLYDHNLTKDTPKSEVDRYQRGEPSGFDNRLLFRPGVSAALIALNGVLRPLVHRSWALMVAAMNGIEESPLEDFLFGARRIPLDPVRPALLDVQSGRCFYCGKGLSTACHVDHFVPWSRHADNSIDNLVAAHEGCNGMKSDYLAAADHVERWRERSRVHAADLAAIARDETWESHPSRTVSVARAIYRALPDDTHLWLAGRDFVRIEPVRIASALAA
jgi:HNH endonuclease